MELGTALLAVGAGERAASFDIFNDTLDPAWIAQALEATGTATIRRRKLPAERAVWLVIGMGLLRDRSIEEVVRHLNLVLPARGERQTVTKAAIAQARTRLGSPPLAALFALTAAAWAPPSADAYRWRGLVVYGVDGTTLRVPDTAENDGTFGRVPTRWESTGGYPLVRLVALMVLRSHVLAGLAFGPYATSELTLAEPLWTQLPDASLTLIDREFATYELFDRLADAARARHWLTRVKKRLRWDVVQRLGPGDALVELRPSASHRRAHRALPEVLRVRAVRYHRRGFRPQTLLTSLLDPATYPATEIVALYHERWEIELGFDEVKTHTLEREEALRSKTPARIAQELWGLAIGYNLVRLAMARVAGRLGVPPPRISFRHALQLVRLCWLTGWLASPGAVPRRLETLDEELALLVLPERRSRQYPRAVKIKMSNYPRKRPRRRRPRAK